MEALDVDIELRSFEESSTTGETGELVDGNRKEPIRNSLREGSDAIFLRTRIVFARDEFRNGCENEKSVGERLQLAVIGSSRGREGSILNKRSL